MAKESSWIDIHAEVMGGKPCIRNTRVTVETIVGLIHLGYTVGELLEAYPYLTEEDLTIALTYSQHEQRGSIAAGGEP